MVNQVNKNQKESVPYLVKVSQASKLLSICRASVHALIDEGELEARKVTTKANAQRIHVRIPRDSLLKFYHDRFGKDLDCLLENPLNS